MVAVAAERAEALARRAADDHVGGWEVAHLRDVALVHVVAEVGSVDLGGRWLDLDREHRLEPPGLHEAARHPADTGEEVDDPERPVGTHGRQ